jgi:hypothetical protein
MAYTYTFADTKTVAFYESYRAIVTPSIIKVVASTIGPARILASEDRSFNDIRLAKWDALSSTMQGLCNKAALKQMQGLDPTDNTYHWSLSTGVCIAKTAAYMIRTEPTILD